MRLFSSPLCFFFHQQRQSKNKGALNADELPALFVLAHCTHTAAFFAVRMSRPHKRRREQSRSRSGISRIRADGRRDQRTKPWPHAHDRKFGCSFVVGTLKTGGGVSSRCSCTHRLGGWSLPMATRGRYRKHDPTNYSLTIFFSLSGWRAGIILPPSNLSGRSSVRVRISIPLAKTAERERDRERGSQYGKL